MGKRILIIEQDSHLARFLTLELESAGYEVLWETDHKEALRLATSRDLELLLFDLQAGFDANRSFLEQLAQVKPSAVIIALASPEDLKAQQDVIHQYTVLVAVKPFVAPILLEQIASIFRGRDYINQHCGQIKKVAKHHQLEVDLANHMVFRKGEQLALTRREYDLLIALMSSPKALTREELLERVWKYENPGGTNIVDVYIRYLRGKIDIEGQASYIETVRGVGYKMRDLTV
ncbi:response regulator transcription factor [Streptococcus sp. 121]|uniref:winged helix-turn-helix transcriptional regulator n=1 Tax=Streptococcus sp. 121 TaxID=2797637 RepID=UPI0018F072FB|nr:response regulator transcription factor [Streptococcus sp. 121]MBJ6746241.1 response regulator transcription factor [Streptococcus sp. 121]